jgi:PAS domain S-box-containing protein
MERGTTDVWDSVEGLPPNTGEFRTPTADRLTHVRARRTRVLWYALAACLAILAAAATLIVYRKTGAHYQFYSGLAMILALPGGFGPTLLASLGSILLTLLWPPLGSMIPVDLADMSRLVANSVLVSVGSICAGLFRRSRLNTLERGVRLEAAASSVRELLEELDAAIVLTDAALHITYVNAQTEQMFGAGRGALLGRPVLSLITTESLQAQPLRLDVLASGRTLRVERQVFRADGTTVDVDLAARLLSGGRLLASVRDTTVRKAEAERQRVERDLLNGIVATSVEGIIVLDLHFRIVFANARAESLLALTRLVPEAMRYARPEWRQGSVDGSDWTRDQHPFARVLATGAPVFDVRSVLEWPDGRRVILSVNAAPLHDAAGQLESVVCAMSDITASSAAEQLLREHNHRFERVTEAMPGVVYKYVIEADGRDRFEYVSGYSVTLFGLLPAVLCADASRGWALVHPEDLPSMHETIMTSYHTLHPWVQEFRVQNPQQRGSWRWVSGRAIPHPGPTPGAVTWNGIYVDITDRRTLEDDLRQIQKIESVGLLAGSIAHDFNNLLTVIMGHAELIGLELPATSEHAESIAEIRTAAESGRALTRQLLGFARKQVSAPQVIDLNELVRRVPPLVGRLLGENISMQLTLEDAAPRVRVDPAQFDQVLINLVVNARDAMSGRGTLYIRTRSIPADARAWADFGNMPEGALVEIAVTDTGAGMSPAVRARAFEPFFTTKEIGHGTGLGLATSFGIVSQAGGTMVIESVVGEGTTVRLLLPVTALHAVDTTARRTSSLRTGTETVLVVDDDLAVGAVTATALRRQGYRVLTAASGLAALELARAEPGVIHLLVTDVVMPQMAGPELAERLTAERPDVRVLFVSGYADGALSLHGVVGDGVQLLQKPYDVPVLVERVRTLLDAPTAGRA